jgi:hypothetical protein
MRLAPPPVSQHLLKQVGKTYPQLDELLGELRLAELEQLVRSDKEHFDTYKGRVQVLTELRQLIRS